MSTTSPDPSLPNKDKVIFELFKLVDDIDTALDMFKGDYEGFSKNTSQRVKKRFAIISSDEVDKLYDAYYKEQL